MVNYQPFVLQCFQSNRDAPSTRVSCSTERVPVGKLFVVEHISGYFVVGSGWSPDRIWVTDEGQQAVYLPTHFASRELNFGGRLGIARYHQFGSPVRMYVEATRRITISGDANIAGVISLNAIGYLVDR